MISVINILGPVCMYSYIPKSSIAHFNRKTRIKIGAIQAMEWMWIALHWWNEIEKGGMRKRERERAKVWGCIYIERIPHGDDKAYAFMHYWCNSSLRF